MPRATGLRVIDLDGELVADLDGKVTGNASAPWQSVTRSGMSFQRGVTISHDATDALANLNLSNYTAIADQGAAPYQKAAVNFLVDGDLKWQIGNDVGDGAYSTGPGDLRDDWFILHRWGADTSLSRDVMYFTDEADPRIGITKNVPVAQLHVSALNGDRPVLTLNHAKAAPVDHWLLTFEHEDAKRGGFWLSSADTVPLKLGIGLAVEPDYPLDVRGAGQVAQLRLISQYSALQQANQPLIYGTSAGGSFEAGDLIIQARAEAATEAGDVHIVGGTTPEAILSVKADGDLRNVGFFSPGGYAAGDKIIAIGTATTAPNANVASTGFYWYGSTRFNFRGASGDHVQLGGVRSGGEPGLAVGLNGTLDTKMFRVAAGVFGLSSGALTAPTMTGHGLMLQDVTAAPSTNPVGGPIMYGEAGAAKVRGTSGTVTTFGPAEPHCPDCGRDFALEWENDAYGHLAVCMWCATEQMTAGVFVREAA